MKSTYKYFASHCLLPPPHNTLKKEDMKQVEKYSKMNPYYESKNDWCVSCEKAYQFTCMKDYQNVYEYLYPEDDNVEYKENFYSDYDDMLDEIDKNINTNPNMSKDEIIKAIKKGYAVENFLDSCIELRLNHHKYCVRREDHLSSTNLSQKYLEGDIGHSKHIKQLNDLKVKGRNIKNKAMSKGGVKKVKLSKRHKNSRSKNSKDYKSPKTSRLINEKKRG